MTSPLWARKPIADLVPDGAGMKRTLGTRDLVALSIGAVIGAGIFSTLGTAAAGEIAAIIRRQQDLMERHVSALSAELEDRPLKAVGRIELWNTFNIVLRRLAEKLVVGEIQDESITVSDQMEWLLTRIQTEKSFIFSHLFPQGTTLRELVATFLAVLELTRLGKLRIAQNESFTDIVCSAREENPLETPTDPATVLA